MNILIFGGTGAMGTNMISLLENTGHEVYVTSRSDHSSYKNINYIKCNAHIEAEIRPVLEMKAWDCIVDFMIYNTAEFKERRDMLLNAAKQYIFLSSARVYASSEERMTEESPRLLDACPDEKYLSTDEYAITKARQEDLLRGSGKRNWTIIRPYITYSSARLQLGFFEKEQWLQRALRGKKILFDRQIASKKTTLTYGKDVAKQIVALIGREEAMGEAFHIATSETATWGEIAEFYCDAISKLTGRKIGIKYVDDIRNTKMNLPIMQINYDRLYNRSFDSSKVEKITGITEYTPLREGLYKCLAEFIKHPVYRPTVKWKNEAVADKLTGDLRFPKEIPGKRNKLKYLVYRLGIKKL